MLGITGIRTYLTRIHPASCQVLGTEAIRVPHESVCKASEFPNEVGAHCFFVSKEGLGWLNHPGYHWQLRNSSYANIHVDFASAFPRPAAKRSKKSRHASCPKRKLALLEHLPRDGRHGGVGLHRYDVEVQFTKHAPDDGFVAKQKVIRQIQRARVLVRRKVCRVARLDKQLAARFEASSALPEERLGVLQMGKHVKERDRGERAGEIPKRTSADIEAAADASPSLEHVWLKANER